MNVCLLRIVRKSLSTLACYKHGKWRARRMHVYTPPESATQDAIRALLSSTDPAKSPRWNMARVRRDDRRALYLGQLAALRAERRMMAAFRL